MVDDAIVIAGAGPVGLSLALSMARRGVRVRVLEAAPQLSTQARASTLHPPTLELFAAWGVLDEVLARGKRVERLQFWERRSRELIADFPYELIAGDTPYPFRLQCPQHIVTRVLKAALEQTGNGEVSFSHRVASVRGDSERAIAHVATPSGEAEVEAPFLCGADGAHSSVRRSLGFGFDGSTCEDRFLLVGTDLDFSRWYPGIGPVSYIFDPHEWAIVMQLPHLVRTVFRLDAQQDVDSARDPDSVRRRMHGLIGEEVDFDLRMSAVYSVHQRVTERFCLGRVALLGDAAHLNNPAGGLGMNSGIHDAAQLGDVLVRGLEQGDEPLEAWASARRRAAMDSVQASADLNYRRLTESTGQGRAARNEQMAAEAADPATARAFLLKASMLEQRA